MTISKTIPANPIQHLRYDETYKEAYESSVKDLKGRSWEIRLFRWAETGGSLSKVCRWALLFFSAAPIFAALHDKIKGIEFSKQTVDQIVSSILTKRSIHFMASALGNQITTSQSRSDSIKQTIISQYAEMIPDSNDEQFEEFDIAEYRNMGVEIVGDPKSKPQISEARAASFFATLYKQDYSDLIPNAKKHVETSIGVQNVKLENPTPMQITTAKDKHGNDYMICSKTFDIIKK